VYIGTRDNTRAFGESVATFFYVQKKKQNKTKNETNKRKQQGGKKSAHTNVMEVVRCYYNLAWIIDGGRYFAGVQKNERTNDTNVTVRRTETSCRNIAFSRGPVVTRRRLAGVLGFSNDRPFRASRGFPVFTIATVPFRYESFARPRRV